MKQIAGIKHHPWFGMINWDDLRNKKVKVPFIPILHSESDVSNFAN